MPEWLAIVLLGVIEGITEFLPISSTGHLLLVENSGLLPPQSELFNVVIQTGAVLAVLLVFWDRARELVSGLGRPETRDYAAKLVAAFLVTGVGGLIAKKAGFTLPKEILPIAWATLIGGVGILLIEGWRRGQPAFTRIGWPVALAVGVAQIAAAIFPGTSRAAATILIALALGVSRRAATEFSFLLGIPTLFAAGGLEIVSEL